MTICDIDFEIVIRLRAGRNFVMHAAALTLILSCLIWVENRRKKNAKTADIILSIKKKKKEKLITKQNTGLNPGNGLSVRLTSLDVIIKFHILSWKRDAKFKGNSYFKGILVFLILCLIF